MVSLTTAQVAEILNVEARTVRRWGDRGCPKIGRGRWDLAKVIPWWIDNVYKAEDDTEAMADAKLEYWQAKARTEKVKADLAEGASMKIEDFKQAWAWRVSEMSSGLGSIPLRIAPVVAGKSESDIRAILDEEMWKIRDKFARTGKFTPDQKRGARK